MFEIIILIQLLKPIASIAVQKGEKPGKWKLIALFAWFGAEFAAAFIIYAVWADKALAYIAAIGCAVASYFLVRYRLKQLPDKEDLLSTIGQEVQ